MDVRCRQWNVSCTVSPGLPHTICQRSHRICTSRTECTSQQKGVHGSTELDTVRSQEPSIHHCSTLSELKPSLSKDQCVPQSVQHGNWQGQKQEMTQNSTTKQEAFVSNCTKQHQPVRTREGTSPLALLPWTHWHETNSMDVQAGILATSEKTCHLSLWKQT